MGIQPESVYIDFHILITDKIQPAIDTTQYKVLDDYYTLKDGEENKWDDLITYQ